MSDIQLNFLELDKQEISIPIYRKKGNEKLDEAKYFGNLPNNIENQPSDDWSGYSISLNKIEEWHTKHLVNALCLPTILLNFNKNRFFSFCFKSFV
jgi:hypothetical protein